MCALCDKNKYDLIMTDRGNFAVLTESVDGQLDGLIPGIRYLTTITPIGNLITNDTYDLLIMLRRYGTHGASAYVDPTYNYDDALAAHEKAVMLASTIDFEWMDHEKQRVLLYGFTSEEQEAMGTGL